MAAPVDIAAAATIIGGSGGVNLHRAKPSRKLGVTLGTVPVVVTGSGGRVGTLLRRAWSAAPSPGLRPIWCGRGQGFDLKWDIGSGPAPDLPPGAVVLHLAAIVAPLSAQDRARALQIGQDVAEACRLSGAVALLAASSAAVYAPSARPAAEEDTPAPVTPNGLSKAKTETALVRACAAAGVRLCRLRIGNVPGADALFGPRPPGSPTLRLDPVPGRDGGPVRSWIGPATLADALARLCRLAADGLLLSEVLNLAQDPPLAMADLLRASGLPWSWGAPNPAVIADAVLSTAQLGRVIPLPPATPRGLMAEVRALAPGLVPGGLP